jgi:hypothetical protein
MYFVLLPAVVSKFQVLYEVLLFILSLFWYRVRDKDPVSVFYLWMSNFPATFVEETVSHPLCVLGSFVEDQLAVDLWVYVWVFYSNPLFFMSVFVPIPC